jgi:hypothetical protein
MRRIGLHLLLGVALVYLSTAFVVIFLPVTTHAYPCILIRYHRDQFDTGPVHLRCRIWRSPHGQVFQIHRTSPLTTETVGWSYDVDNLSAEQIRELIENPQVAPEAIPPWSRLHRRWPSGLREFEPYLSRRGIGLVYDVCMGWPCGALQGSYVDPDWNGGATWHELHGVIPIHRTLRWSHGGTLPSLVALPWIPYWPGFVLNAAFYGTLTYIVWASWRALRRWHRRRRPGHCVQCGYNLTGNTSGRCPECGAALSLK